jgi:hypothetical protein
MKLGTLVLEGTTEGRTRIPVFVLVCLGIVACDPSAAGPTVAPSDAAAIDGDTDGGADGPTSCLDTLTRSGYPELCLALACDPAGPEYGLMNDGPLPPAAVDSNGGVHLPLSANIADNPGACGADLTASDVESVCQQAGVQGGQVCGCRIVNKAGDQYVDFLPGGATWTVINATTEAVCTNGASPVLDTTTLTYSCPAPSQLMISTSDAGPTSYSCIIPSSGYCPAACTSVKQLPYPDSD